MDSPLPANFSADAAADTRVVPCVSVVMPTHNRPALLDEAVASVLAQRQPDWEVVIVDDASNPPVDVRRWPAATVRLIRHDASQGGAASKADGGAAARGEFVAYLDDDDRLDPAYLERAVGALQRHPGIDVVFMGVGWFGRGAEYSARIHDEAVAEILEASRPEVLEPGLWHFGDSLLAPLLRTVPMPFQRPVVRREALQRIGLHRRDCLLWDCEWALRAAMTARCALLGEPLYQQRDDGQGYHSRPDRERAQLESALEMTLRLYRAPPPYVTAAQRDLLRRAASRNALNLSYFLSHTPGTLLRSLQAWCSSQRLQFSPRSLKLPLGALTRALKRTAAAR